MPDDKNLTDLISLLKDFKASLKTLEEHMYNPALGDIKENLSNFNDIKNDSKEIIYALTLQIENPEERLPITASPNKEISEVLLFIKKELNKY